MTSKPSPKHPVGVPKLARWILKNTMSPEDSPYAAADLEEDFDRLCRERGEWHARRWYWGQVVRSTVPNVRARFSGPGGSQSGRWLTGLWLDLRLATKMLIKTPIASAVIVLSLGVGIGAVTIAVTLSSSVLFPPSAGFESPETLVAIYGDDGVGDPYRGVSFPDFEEMRGSVPGLEDAVAFSVRRVVLGEQGAARPALAEFVSGNYFDVTRMSLALGRGFAESEVAQGPSQAPVVLSDHVWRGRFNADPGVLGSELRVDGASAIIVGVATPGVMSRRVPTLPDIWIPIGIPSLTSDSKVAALKDVEAALYYVLGRVRPGVGVGQLEAQLAVFSQARDESAPLRSDARESGGRRFTVVSEARSRINPRARPLLVGLATFVAATVGLILFIACTNVTGLFVARAATREREMAVRRALGAGSSRVVRMLLVEGVLPGLIGGALGLVFAFTALGMLQTISLPVSIPVRFPQAPDILVLICGMVLALGVSATYSLIPAFTSAKSDLTSGLRERRSGGQTRRGLRGFLVLGQTGAALVLVVGAVAFYQSLRNAAMMDLGLNPEGVVLTSKAISEATGSVDAPTYVRTLIEEVESHAAVERVVVGSSVESTVFVQNSPARVFPVGRRPENDDESVYLGNSVTPGYFDLMGINMLRGRSIDATDVKGSPLVAVVSETFARRFWGDEDAIGRTFGLDWVTPRLGVESPAAQARMYRVVGVAADGLYVEFDDLTTPYFWTAFYQEPSSTFAVLARGPQNEAGSSLLAALRERVDREAGEVPLIPPGTLVEHQAVQVLHLRIASILLSWGGGFGLLLALSGIYGVVAFAVTRRRREMAIRMAVGADRLQVVSEVAWEGVRLAGIGVLLGLICAVPLLSALRSVLFGVSPLDPIAVGGGVALVLVAAIAASLVPARRTAGIAPMRTLREE